MQNVKILVLDGPSRQVLPTLKGLNDIGCNITTLNYSKLDIGYTSRYPQKKLLYKINSHDKVEMKKVIDAEICSGKYDIVIPLSDISTQIIAENLETYSKYVKAPVNDYDTFMKAYDKFQTMEICQKNNIPCTRTKMDDESLEEFISKVGYPIVVKPRSACGSVGFRCLENESELDSLLETDGFNLSGYVIQEYVEQHGRQYNIHLFMDNDSNLAFAIPTQKCRWFPVDGGSSCFCRVVDRKDLVEICTKLLKEIGWKGYCEIEMIEDVSEGAEKIIEINGRASASIRICQLYGVNVAESMVKLAYEEELSARPFEYRDVRMRCIHTDLLWLLKSKNRFKTTPAWFNNRHTHDQIFSWSDPLTFFPFSIQSLLKYKQEMKKRER